MYRSHHSYGARCGLGTPETDLIVDLVRERGPRSGLYGAKITGGGAGGTVAVLGAGSSARAGVEEMVAAYARRSGNTSRVIAGSADGAVAQPVRRVTTEENGEVHDV
jgi:L-arabinokinase